MESGKIPAEAWTTLCNETVGSLWDLTTTTTTKKEQGLNLMNRVY